MTGFTSQASVSVVLASTSLLSPSLSSLALYSIRQETEIFEPRSIALAPPSH